ncbi:Cytochrome c oxidase assembly protein cox19 [Podospora bellae-mahoneyi]|uniref:Cytochrome c oxidase assembly protein cox19 n=1 Tax=Podospora bellae-mahoneyi TaxID=2093777 RepID=A0ABR0FZ43_9PEZI|nr:Cytochrome c oxidase assembly protein cox19 [Podospora bellae-mahoneyi]
MSTFGSPGALPNTKPTPPQRGSFPLDHDGECKDVMMSYLSCIKKVKGINQDECRQLAKSYLGCRMDQFVTPQPPKMRWQYLCCNLMAKDDFKNLGFKEDKTPSQAGANTNGVKGELQW